MRVGFLLELDRASEAQAIRGSIAERTAELIRLQALAHLVLKQMPQAHMEAQKALETEPEWELVRFTAGAVNYWGSVRRATRGRRSHLPGILPDLG